ncbi:cytochrome c oxidase subunit 5A, mitochondrial-like [Sitophilus oryzae]|uniref:Cytochrome c oxidase subunit 5A, mitochondrial n=1 Tax=Sitophilus oryzae TaxID=7048 RepID=A0A6J2YTC2_SITOR|nr:cytochrome c oxidase subunit 5A, mitochondrial-like [Sitophilus oryzae]
MALARMFTRPIIRHHIGQVFKTISSAPRRVALLKNPSVYCSENLRFISHLAIRDESVEEMICRYECIFGRDDADGWDVRQAMNDIAGYDSVPEPRIIIAALHACRRLNDYALTVRFLEMVKLKCGNYEAEIYPYIVQEVGPTVAELGCDFPENLGYDKPELWLESVYEM